MRCQWLPSWIRCFAANGHMGWHEPFRPVQCRSSAPVAQLGEGGAFRRPAPAAVTPRGYRRVAGARRVSKRLHRESCSLLLALRFQAGTMPPFNAPVAQLGEGGAFRRPAPAAVTPRGYRRVAGARRVSKRLHRESCSLLLALRFQAGTMPPFNAPVAQLDRASAS